MRGVGGEIVGVGGRSWGRAVTQDRRSWHLDTGRAARKAQEGRRWRWAGDSAIGLDGATADGATADGTTADCATPDGSPFLVCAPGPDSEASMTPSSSLYASPQFPPWTLSSPDASPTGPTLGCHSGNFSPFLLPAPSEALLLEMEGDRLELRNAPLVDTNEIKAALSGCEGAVGLPETVVLAVCNSLCLADAMRSKLSCKVWWAVLSPHIPVHPPPPQADIFLKFCLLEFLIVFDDGRLPLPMSAVYHEMRVVARRLVSCPYGRALLEAQVQEQPFLRDRQPHHIAWSPDLKLSGYKSLERMAKHFHTEKLIQCSTQKLHKRIHHSPNTRTCKELVLTFVNRKHPLFVGHDRWSQQAGVQRDI